MSSTEHVEKCAKKRGWYRRIMNDAGNYDLSHNTDIGRIGHLTYETCRACGNEQATHRNGFLYCSTVMLDGPTYINMSTTLMIFVINI